MAGRAAHPAPARCPGCRAPIIRQLVGRTAALNVTADPQPIPLHQAQQLREPNRLIWHLHTGPHTTPRLTWISPSIHPPDCPTPHVIEHRCPPADPTTLF